MLLTIYSRRDKDYTMGEYALDDDYILPGKGKNATLFGAFNIFPGKVLVVPGLTQYTTFNVTAELGTNNLVALSLMAWMGKNNYKTRKVDEWIEVSPNHVQYYQIVTKQKEDIENKVREGLIRISQSLSDIELLEHDIRKYERYLQIIEESEEDLSSLREKAEKGDKEAEEEYKERQRKKKIAEMALKSIFVDQVDYNAGRTGQGPGRLSMAFMRNSNIFPTIVDDFMEMESVKDLEEGRLSSIPVVEKNFLKVKFKYYLQWKSMFAKQVRKRLERLRAMHRSRMSSLEEFKKWATPYILRLKAIKNAFESPGAFIGLEEKFPFWHQGEAIALNKIKWWGWRALTPAETFRETGELKELMKLYEKYEGEFTSPYDDFTRDVLIFGDEYGLINKYKWMTKEWVDSKAKGLIKEFGLDNAEMWTFIIVVMTRYVFKNPKAEFEDTDWEVYGITMSSNALLVKLLESEAKYQQVEFYLDEMLGREVELKKIDRFIGYMEEAGKYYAVVDGDYVRDKSGKPVTFQSLFELLKSMGKQLGGDFRPIPARIVYYKKKGGNYIIEGREYESLDEYRDEARKKAKSVSDPWESASIRAYLLKPESSRMFREFLEDWLNISLKNWKYRKHPGIKYERDFFDRITQYYLVPTGGRWAGIVGVLKSKFGV